MRTEPLSVNLTALFARFIIICWILELSPMRCSGMVGSTSTKSETESFFGRRRFEIIEFTLLISSGREYSSGKISSFPEFIFE